MKTSYAILTVFLIAAGLLAATAQEQIPASEASRCPLRLALQNQIQVLPLDEPSGFTGIRVNLDLGDDMNFGAGAGFNFYTPFSNFQLNPGVQVDLRIGNVLMEYALLPGSLLHLQVPLQGGPIHRLFLPDLLPHNFLPLSQFHGGILYKPMPGGIDWGVNAGSFNVPGVRLGGRR